MEENIILENKRKNNEKPQISSYMIPSPKKFKHKPFKFMSNAEKKRVMDKEAWKDHVRQDFKNNPKLLRSLEFNKKCLSQLNKPWTPHNTTQYLTSNYCLGRNENSYNPLIQFDSNDDILIDYLNEGDDYCIPGGSNKELLKLEYERPRFLSADSDEMSKLEELRHTTEVTEKLNTKSDNNKNNNYDNSSDIEV